MISLSTELASAAGSRSFTLQIEYKNTQQILGAFGIILTGPTGLIFTESSCTYLGSDYGELGYDKNIVTLGGFSNNGIRNGNLMKCQFDLGTEFSIKDFSFVLDDLSDPARVSLLNTLSTSTDFLLKEITPQTSTLPTVTITTPPDGFSFNSYAPLAEIKGTIADPGSVGIEKVELQISYDGFYLFEQNGRLRPRSTPAWIPTYSEDGWKTWAYSPDATWTSGKTYTITARATDKAGHLVTKTSQMTYTDKILISGIILDGAGKPIPDVSITFTDNNKRKSIIYTDDSGRYTWNLPDEVWSGAVTLDKPGYTFDPSTRVLTSISTNQLNSNFTATAVESEQDARVIILAGGDVGNYLWPATKKVANDAYKILIKKGITKPNIRYLSLDVNQDLDHDKVSDIYGLSSSAALEEAITKWAAEYVNNKKPLIIYMVDHGDTGGQFMVTKPQHGQADSVTSAKLQEWLNALQTKTGAKVILIMDACYSGSFVRDLIPSKGMSRIVIASTDTQELAYFASDGDLSFSSLFWKYTLMGASIRDSFAASVQMTRAATRNQQNPIMDADSDGVYIPSKDTALVSNLYLGTPFFTAAIFPEINDSIPDSYMEEKGAGLTLWVQLMQDVTKIDRVWGVVVPPGTGNNSTEPITDLPILTLSSFVALLTHPDKTPMANAVIKTAGNETAITDSQGRFTLMTDTSNATVDLTINGVQSAARGVQVKLSGKTLSMTTSSTPASTAPLLDVDKSGTVDATDGVLLLRKLNGASTIDTGVVLPTGQTNSTVMTNINAIATKLDVDQSGLVDATDGVLILRKLNGASTLDTGVVLPTGQNNASVMTAIDAIAK
ncbi:MAG: hypothetical protein H7839_19020 [Magnetococcus sp. YQC-5]